MRGGVSEIKEPGANDLERLPCEYPSAYSEKSDATCLLKETSFGRSRMWMMSIALKGGALHHFNPPIVDNNH